MTDLTSYAKEVLKKQNGFISANNYEVVKVEDGLIHVRVPIERRWDSLVKEAKF
jgi:hypothetical protein